jgi:hypothetical protein
MAPSRPPSLAQQYRANPGATAALKEAWSIPRCFEGETVAVLGAGPSLNRADVNYLRGRCRVVAVNRTHELCPWADWLYAADVGRFWFWCAGEDRMMQEAPDAFDFPGTKIAIWPPDDRENVRRYVSRLVQRGVKLLRYERANGISEDPGVVRGDNGVHHVLSAIHHTGAKRVLLLGVEMAGGHFHEGWPGGVDSDHQAWPYALESLAIPLARCGVTVINCSGPNSRVRCWPTVALREALV